MIVETLKTKWNESDFKQNTHIAFSKSGCLIVDAGAPTQELETIIGDKKVLGVLITHGHYDHILYVEDYKNRFDCPIFLHLQGSKFMSDAVLNCSQEFSSPITFNLKGGQTVIGGEMFAIGDFLIQCLHTPGHSDDSMCFLVNDINEESKPTLFTGDTVFAKKLGKAEFVTGNREKLIKSLYGLLELDFDEVYPGHARKTSKNELLENLPILLEEPQTKTQ